MGLMVVAHRGGPGERFEGKKLPENTLEAFRHALASGCDSIETDLRLMKLPNEKSAVICCSHDRNVTVAQRERIPKLFDLLHLVSEHNKRARKKMLLHLEIKETGFEREFVNMIKDSGLLKQVLVISFSRHILARIHALNPKLRTGYLFEKKAFCHAYPFFCQVVLPSADLTTLSRIRAWHSAGKEIHVWTINQSDQAQYFSKKIEGIITDYPKRILNAMSFPRKRKSKT